SRGIGDDNSRASSRTPRPRRERNRDADCTYARQPDARYLRPSPRRRLARGDVRLDRESHWTTERNTGWQAVPDGAGSVARRTLVPRSGRQQRSHVGTRAGDQEADAARDLRTAVHVVSDDVERAVPAH